MSGDVGEKKGRKDKLPFFSPLINMRKFILSVWTFFYIYCSLPK
jgi:hypothetical protein